ncbi:claudin-23-like [Polyodon spathula]|uniref:claudin-23-like n=1 Tax=Polyodon spathula TaxID=7913 RepID=UPI001B7F0471|nr:claudin-23-like [Polyodon spathula]
MRTPAVMIIGIVLASCGLVLDLVSTVAPKWREVRNILGAAQDEVLQQGIWDICQAFDASRTLRCGQTDENYFKEQVVTSAKGLMIASLIVTMAGIVVASLGIRCWEETPNLLVAGLGGILIIISGILCIIPVAWYTSLLNSIKASGSDIRVGYCIVLGYIGSCFMFVGGGALTVCLFQLCLRKKEMPPNSYLNKHYNYPTSPRSFINTVDVHDFIRHQQPAHFPSASAPRISTDVCDFTGRHAQVATQQTIATDFSTNQLFYADF